MVFSVRGGRGRQRFQQGRDPPDFYLRRPISLSVGRWLRGSGAIVAGETVASALPASLPSVLSPIWTCCSVSEAVLIPPSHSQVPHCVAPPTLVPLPLSHHPPRPQLEGPTVEEALSSSQGTVPGQAPSLLVASVSPSPACCVEGHTAHAF